MRKNFGPPSFPLRDPKTLPKNVGRVANPPGNLVLGGRGESSRIPVRGSKYRVTARGGGQ